MSVEVTIYRYTTAKGYEAIGPVLIARDADTCERATRRLAVIAERGGWPKGEYHADLCNGVVAVIER